MKFNIKLTKQTVFISISLFSIWSFIILSCEKFEPKRVIKVQTDSIINIVNASCDVMGSIIDIGENGVIQHGHCWSTAQNPSIDDFSTKLGSKNSTGTFSSNLSGLSAGTTYYVRAYVQNKDGDFYGDQKSFSTPAYKLPTLTTTSISSITGNSAQSGGNITDAGGATVTARGVCWSTSQNPTIADSKTSDGATTGTFTSSITGLTANTTYYARAYATNSVGTAYGEEYIIKTATGTVMDIDGNVYYTVTVGTQVWMAENLKTTQFNDASPIPIVSDGSAWSNLSTPGYCWYNNDEGLYKNTYGALYNWYTVNTGKLCPTGWHVPTDAEWKQLEMSLGMSQTDADKDEENRGTDEGGKLKDIGTNQWISPNTGATNESGFTALPGGGRSWDGTFQTIGFFGYWWTSTSEDMGQFAWHRNVGYDHSIIWRAGMNNEVGFSVRCIKD